MSRILSFYAFTWIIIAQNFNLTLIDYFLLHQNGVRIKTIGKNLQGDFMLSFQNGQTRKYASDFSNYIAMNTSQSIDKFQATQIVISMTLSNGSFFYATDRKLIFITNAFTKIKTYHYYSYAQEESYTINQTILESIGFPINVFNNSKTFYTLACNNSIVVAYNGIVRAYSYKGIFLLGGNVCTAAVAKSQQIISSIDKIIAKISLYVSVANQAYNLNITSTFSFNYSINHFDLTSTSFSYVPIYLSIYSVQSLFIANGLLMIQSDNLGLKVTSIFNINNSSMCASLGIPTDQTIAFFYIYNAFYILQKTGLIKISYSQTTDIILAGVLVASLPSNTYGLTLNSPINAFFVFGKPYLYKGGICQGQSYYQANICMNYECLDSNCTSCPIFPSLCSNYSQYSDENSTQNINSSNSQMQNNTQETNSTQHSNHRSIYYFQSNSYFRSFLEYFLGLIRMLMSAPAARRFISPVFYYFGIFDDIFFYQFHDRIYGETMNKVFENLNQIQKNKWSILNSSKILIFFKVDMDLFEDITDYQQNYNQYTFSDQDHIAVGSEGIWANLHNFFIVGLPAIILVFFLGRNIFKCLFKSSVSRLFRKFDFWWFLLLLIFDGNIEQFSFYQFTEWKNMFFFDKSTKLMKFQAILFGFCLVLISISLYFLSCAFQRQHKKYLMDNSKASTQTQFSLTIQFGIKNFYLGLMHNLLRNFGYKNMVLVLFASEVIFACLFVYFIFRKSYKNLLKIWCLILLSSIKMMLIITMMIDYETVNKPVIQMVQQFIFLSLVLVFLGGILLQSYHFLRQWIYIIKIVIFKSQKTPLKINKKTLTCKTKIKLNPKPKQSPQLTTKLHHKKAIYMLQKDQKSQNCKQQNTLKIKRPSRFAKACIQASKQAPKANI